MYVHAPFYSNKREIGRLLNDLKSTASYWSNENLEGDTIQTKIIDDHYNIFIGAFAFIKAALMQDYWTERKTP